MIVYVVKWLAAGFASAAILSAPAVPEYGIGWADATCPQAGRTISEDFYTRTYVRSCTWTWNASRETPMRIASGTDPDGLATNWFLHFKPSATCAPEEWYRRVVAAREPRSVCRHRGGEAT